jgi:enoyl-CoA hydratase/carnithine racemase
MTSKVQVEIKAPVATITLNKPERLNALVNGPLAVQAAKQSIDGTFWRERDAWLAWEADQAAGPLLSEDRQAGMRAAAQRKRADFQGT